MCDWFKKCSISDHSIVLDWQKVRVSLIIFDYRTQSKSIERLEFDWVRLPNVRLVRLTSPGNLETKIISRILPFLLDQ